MQGQKEITDCLQGLLVGELTAIDQYLAHARIYEDLGVKQLAQKAAHESDHEKQHAEAIIDRLLFFEVKPDLSKRHKLNIASEVEKMLRSDLELEYQVVEALKEAISLCEKHKDYVTRKMLVIQLEDTEMDHAYYLEKQLRLIDKLGIQLYLSTQL